MIRKLINFIVDNLQTGAGETRKRSNIEPGKSPEQIQTFSYQKPMRKGSKEFVLLSKTDDIRCGVHVIRKGSEEHLHSHDTIDGFWFVLKGVARFHGENEMLGEFESGEGIFIPRGTRYWFESGNDEDVELLQVLHVDEKGWHRQNHANPNFDKRTMVSFDARKL